jgi:rod shape-determining protein MreD
VSYLFFLPLISLLLIIFQVSVTDIMFFGRISLEISLLLVIYAGFHMKVIEGFILSFILGFFLDCIIGSIPGLFTFIYTLIFFISLLVYPKLFPKRRPLFIIIFTLMCALLNQLLLILFNELTYEVNLFQHILRIFLPQALIISIVSPVFFNIFFRLEVLLNGGNAKSFKRT